MTRVHTESASLPPEREKLRGHLTTPAIIFLILAMVGPVSGFTQPLSLGFALGNGAGMPSAVAIAMVVMLCFAAGYAAMSRHVSRTGAFYAYVTKGLGRPAGGAAAFVALLAYTSGLCAMCGAIGYYAQAFVVEHAGLHAPWWAYTAIALAIIFVLGLRNVESSLRVQVVLVALGLAVLVAFDIGVVVRYGAHVVSLSSFSPHVIWGNGNSIAIAMMFAFFLVSGIEMAAVYAEESRNPEKTVGRATYGAVLVIGGMYFVSAICAVAVCGADDIQRKALVNPPMFAFDIVGQVLGAPVETLLAVIVITSLLASMIGLHSAIARYIVALARDQLLPRGLAHVHPVLGAPQRAGTVAIAVVVLVVAAFALAGGDPFMTLFSSLSGLTVLSQMLLWVAACLAFIVYFRRHSDSHWITTLVLPVVALVAMSAVVYLVVTRFTMITGTDVAWINALPWLLVPMILLGAGLMFYLRSKKPEVYAQIWPDEAEPEAVGREENPKRGDERQRVHKDRMPRARLRAGDALGD